MGLSGGLSRGPDGRCVEDDEAAVAEDAIEDGGSEVGYLNLRPEQSNTFFKRLRTPNALLQELDNTRVSVNGRLHRSRGLAAAPRWAMRVRRVIALVASDALRG